MSKLLSKRDYLFLQRVDIQYDGAMAKVLNGNGCVNWTICPECGIDDFTHCEGCSLQDIELNWPKA